MPKVMLQWQAWIYGLFAGLIGGGASSVSSGFANMIVDPKDFNIGNGGGVHLLKTMSATFIISGIIATMAYLSKSPLPQVETITTQKTLEVTNPAGDTSTTKLIATTTTSSEPTAGVK